MEINRNNYEEFFLLYADKELSADERNLVKLFVEDNPDLQDEFFMLQQVVVNPDNDINFNDKILLYKKEVFIDKNNYEEKFLLYADKELNLSEIEKIEKFICDDKPLQDELNLLQLVKFEPDNSVVFPNKSLLYKKLNDGKIIPLRWKALVAAILIGAGLWTVLNYLPAKSPETVTANKTTGKKQNISPADNVKQNVITSNEKRNMPFEKTVKRSYEIIKINPQSKQQKITAKAIEPVTKNAQFKAKFSQSKDDEVVTNENKNIIEKAGLPAQQPEQISTEPIAKSFTKNIVVPQNTNAQTTSYINDTNEKSENYVFYNVTKEEFQKSKLGILFKKIKRAVERKNPLREKAFRESSIQEIPNN